MRTTKIAAVLAVLMVAPAAHAQVPTLSDPNAQGEEIYVANPDAPNDGDIAPPALAMPPQGNQPQAQTPQPPPAESVSRDQFVDALSPYGTWVNVDNLGSVWRPDPETVGSDFQPYVTGGHWEYTDYGWTWTSDYDWGWAPYHYGRWWLDPYYGWVWYPGFSWAPAWVSWRFGGDYYGWLPLTPFGWAYAEAMWGQTWCFTDGAHFASSDMSSNIVPQARVVSVYHATTPPAGGASRSGPPVQSISSARGTPVRPIPLARSGALNGHPSLTAAFRPAPRPAVAPPPAAPRVVEQPIAQPFRAEVQPERRSSIAREQIDYQSPHQAPRSLRPSYSPPRPIVQPQRSFATPAARPSGGRR